MRSLFYYILFILLFFIHYFLLFYLEWTRNVCWPRLTYKRVEPVVSISWASCMKGQTVGGGLWKADTASAVDSPSNLLLIQAALKKCFWTGLHVPRQSTSRSASVRVPSSTKIRRRHCQLSSCYTLSFSSYSHGQTDRQTDRHSAVINALFPTVFPLPFRLAASVSWYWSWEKEGREVEVTVLGRGHASKLTQLSY